MERVVQKVSEIASILSSFSTKNKISLPRLAVVGQQSSGKSSVLEGIIGMDILPRAAGLCTRVPLILSITNDLSLENNLHGSFLHLNPEENRKFQSPQKQQNADNIRAEIIRRTNELTQPNELKNSPITLSVRAPNLPNLSLVDLPGLTKISTSGQSASVVKDIDAMVRDFISQESTIILAVVPANSDLANSDSLGIAQEYDPKGDRTIGIVTKLDLMDKGTSAMSVLQNKEFYLKLGYIGVVNRGQLDLEKKTTVEEARRKEMNFFLSHPDYEPIADHCGFEFLKQKLASVFASHVSKALPKLNTELVSIQKDAHKALEKLGGNVEEPKKKASQAIIAFNKLLVEYMSGCLREKDVGALFGGSKVAEAMRNLGETVEKCVQQNLKGKNINELNLKTMGVHSNMLFGENAFINVISSIIGEFMPLMRSELFKVMLEINQIIDTSVKDSSLSRYPKLAQVVIMKSNELLNDSRKTALERIATRIKIDTSHINTDHPSFFLIPLTVFKKVNEEIPTSMKHHERNLKVQEKVTEELVKAYLNIVQEDWQDFFIRLVQKEIINPLVSGFLEILITSVSTTDDIESLVAERPEFAIKRKELMEKVKVIDGALKILKEVNM